MTKHIELKRFNQGTVLATHTLALAPLVIEGFEEFKGSFSTDCACRLGLRPSRRCSRLMRSSFVASATSVTLTGRAIDGAWSIVRSAGTAAKLPSGGYGCVNAAALNWSFPAGRRFRRRTFCRAGRSTRC